MKKEYFEIVTWPEIQNYMECDGFNLNCSLANSEFNVERYGFGAYYVNSEWKQEQDKILYNEPIKMWLARDEDDDLYLYSNKPVRTKRIWEDPKSEDAMEIKSSLFPSVRWEDYEPTEVSIKLV